MGQPHVNKNRTRTTIRIYSNQMIEQINIALEQKGPEFLSLGHWNTAIRTNAERASVKSDEENEHPAFFPPNRTIL